MGSETIQITEAGDLYLNSERAASTVSDAKKTAQDLWVLLRTVKGSYAFNLDFGIDYPSIIGTKAGDSYVKEVISREVLKHPSVNSISDFTILRPIDEKRRIFITLKVLLTSGTTVTVSGGI